MATAPQLLSPEEFHARYEGEKPGYEYWFGEAIQKPVGTTDHGLLQRLLGEFLAAAGLRAGSEIKLCIDRSWEPIPDLIASRGKLGRPYPTTPPDIVVEILSPDDRMSHMIRKCREYARIGVSGIFVLDPMERDGWLWNTKESRLDSVQSLDLPNGSSISLPELWQRLDAELE